MATGDPRSFEVFYCETFDLMYREARRTTGADHATGLDLVHDAMLKATRCIKPMSAVEHVRRWARSVARSVCYDWLRKQQRDLQRLRQVSTTQSANDEDSCAATQRQAKLQWLESQIDELPAELRKLFAWRYRMGWTLQRIARRLGMKTGVVDGRLRRALEVIRENAREELIDE